MIIRGPAIRAAPYLRIIGMYPWEVPSAPLIWTAPIAWEIGSKGGA